MGEFTGNAAYTLDSKGRATIPVLYRDALGESFFIGLNSTFRAIALYTLEKWNSINEGLERIPGTDALGMSYVRLIRGNVFAGETDAQGRVLLPASLREQVGMDKAIRFVGMGQYLEIWDEERYKAENERAQMSVEELLRHVNDRYFM